MYLHIKEFTADNVQKLAFISRLNVKIVNADFAVALASGSSGVEAKSEGGFLQYLQRHQRDAN